MFSSRRGITGGHASGQDGVSVRIGVGRDSTAADFAADWVTTNEMGALGVSVSGGSAPLDRRKASGLH